MAKYSYFKLSKDATLFTDPKSGLTVRNKEVVKMESEKANSSAKVRDAVKGGHLREATEEEYNKWQAKTADDVEDELEGEEDLVGGGEADDDEDEDEEDDPETMTKSELMDAIRDDETIPEEEKKALSNKNKEDLVALYKKYIK